MKTGTREYRMGRRQAAVDRTRERILLAVMTLWMQSAYDEVTLDAVAEAAGVTRQTVLRHFGTKEGLFTAAVDWYGPQEEAARELEPGDPEAAVGLLADRYEFVGEGMLRLLEVEGRIAPIDYAIEAGRRGHRAWLETVFEAFLPPAGDPRREETVLTLYAATDLQVWKVLRKDLKQSKARTEAAMLALVRGALGLAPADPGEGTP